MIPHPWRGRAGPGPKSRARGPRLLYALALAIMVGICSPRGVLAQAPLGPAILSDVAVTDGPPGETRVLLTFNQILPQYSILANDNARPAIAFAGAVRASSARTPNAVHGLLASVAFQQNDNILTVAFSGSTPIRIVATPVAGRAVSVVITAVPRAERQADEPGTGALPAFADAAPGEDGFEVVPLKYADVSEVVGLLTAGQSIKPNDAFNPQEPAFGSAGIQNGASSVAPNLYNPTLNQNAEAAGQSVGQSVDDAIGIDRRLNAIILKGSPERIARLKEKIAKLDVPVTSVLLETVFVELTQTGAKNLGLDLNNASNQIAVATVQSGSFVPSGAFNGVGNKFLTSVSLQAAISAEVQKGEGRIISKPRIAAQSGSSAKIITGDALPILTSIALSGVNAVSQQVQYVNVGVTLQIAPRVSDDGYVTSHVFCEVSSVTGFSQGYPTISQREASTSATVKDGESFVIGGLTQDSELSTNGKIPGVGDLPGIGRLFQLRTDTKSKTDLYIVVTPHIVRGNVAALTAGAN